MNIIKAKEIVTIYSKEMTLDDIFIKVTGVSIDDITSMVPLLVLLKFISYRLFARKVEA